MITSIQNSRIQQIRNLIRDSSERQSQQRCVIEGVRLMEEALQSGLPPVLIVYSQDLSPRGFQMVDECKKRQMDVEEIPSDLFRRISDTEQPQGILGVFPIQSIPFPGDLNFVIILDNLRDPGNLGTILRTAAAAGAQAVWAAPGCADIFSPKVLRAGMGAHFHLSIQTKIWEEIRQSADRHRLSLYVADSNGGKSLWQTNLAEPVGLVICNEAEGPTQAARDVVNNQIHIPMPGKFESLNAGTAAAVLIFEVVRQRSR